MKKYLIAGIALLLAVGGGIYWATSSGGDRIKIISTDTVTRGDVRKTLEATGIIKAQVGAMVKVGARSTGELVEVRVKVGDEVEKDELLAVVDDRELESQLREAQARYKLARARYDYARKNLPRRERLVKKNLEPQDTLDQALQDMKVSKYEMEAAQAKLETLRIQQSYTRIKSPIDGVVSQVAAQEGETIVSGLNVSNLVTVLAPEKLEMWIYVDETDVGRVVKDLPVEFSVDAYPDRVFIGSIDRVYPEPEIRDNIVYYRALVKVEPQEARLLRPEMTTQCRIIVETVENVLTIPNTALKWVGGKQRVFRVIPGQEQPEEMQPDLGLQGLERSEVLSGLEEGDEVATQLVLPKSPEDEEGM
ncbi:efflux RND transporter periplasmic adaptor subunit [Desulfovibrio oxyclinae]|uniref:efflux RND transporter periplasmic adaptor subunit n=1 Tax=Desulfovibrio oxyclinae TaxID=63560 RepID=UPI00035DBBC0|nr:efflux RND transporter periplasmic adaptor subunit [Desulfovibrio oxyclinae]